VLEWTPGALLILSFPIPTLSQQATPWCFTGVHPGEVDGTVFLPEGDLFCPLLADPKAEHSFLSVLNGSFPPFEEGGAQNGDLRIGSVGIPVTVRWAGFSSRLRVYHQSSHLGDEFLLSSEIERKNLSFEAVDLLLSQEIGPLRAYGGGEILFNREPETLESTLAHAGLEG